MTTTAHTTAPAPEAPVNAIFTATTDAGETTSFGPYPMQAWKVRALSTLVNTRTGTAMAHAFRRDPLTHAETEPGALATIARDVREYAIACRAARWDGGCLTSAANPLSMTLPLFEALIWVTCKLAKNLASLEGVTPDKMREWREMATQLAVFADKQSNVPPSVDRDLARDGFTTAELVATQAHYVATQVLNLYRRLPAVGNEGYGLRLAIANTEDALADVLAIIEEGVRYGLGLQKTAKVDPESTAQWAALMGRPSGPAAAN